MARAEEALTLARKLSHPFNVGMALFTGAAVLHHCHRQGQVTRQWAEEAVALSTAQGFPHWSAWSLILQGTMLARRGQGTAGIEQVRQGLAASRATGAEVYWPYFLALLAEAYGTVGQVEEGLTVLAEALAAAGEWDRTVQSHNSTVC